MEYHPMSGFFFAIKMYIKPESTRIVLKKHCMYNSKLSASAYLITKIATGLMFAVAIFCANPTSAQIKAIWLTHNNEDPTSIVVNWQSVEPGSSIVYFQKGNDPEAKVENEGNRVLHHVRIPLAAYNTTYSYRVETGKQASEKYSFKGYPSRDKELRVAVVGNWGYADQPDLSHLLQDDPHVLMTLGDNVPNLHVLCGEGLTDCIAPYIELVRSHPDVFRTIPLMPVLGNHDKEIRPRGTKYPPLAVYDTNAVVYRKFFELPGKEWAWKFSIPEHDVTFVALDINHAGDLGTTWQSSRSYKVTAEQFRWYTEVMNKEKNFVVTLSNERNDRVRKMENGEWGKVMEQGNVVISGYGNFQERADAKGFPYFTTSLKAGDLYPDVDSRFMLGKPGYMLLTFSADGSYRFEIKTLEGKVSDVIKGHRQKE